MNNTIIIDTFGKQLNDSLTINSINFGNVTFPYRIINIKGNKYLRYRIGELSKIYMVDYDIIEKEITLHEYFRNCLKYLNLQIKKLNDDEELKQQLKDDDKLLIDYLEKIKESYENNL